MQNAPEEAPQPRHRRATPPWVKGEGVTGRRDGRIIFQKGHYHMSEPKCRCDELEARVAALETRLGLSRQPTLFAVGPAPLPGEKYPAEFERCWEATGRVGTKAPALKAWVKAGRPPHAIVSTAWNAYLRSERPVRLGAIQDLSTWLNARGHLQRWEPAREAKRPEVAARSSGPAYQAPQTSCFPHAENPRCHTKRITPGCPECKEQAAREAGRTMTEDEALQPPDWMGVGGGAT